jgi:hypothetical protein
VTQEGPPDSITAYPVLGVQEVSASVLGLAMKPTVVATESPPWRNSTRELNLPLRDSKGYLFLNWRLEWKPEPE